MAEVFIEILRASDEVFVREAIKNLEDQVYSVVSHLLRTEEISFSIHQDLISFRLEDMTTSELDAYAEKITASVEAMVAESRNEIQKLQRSLTAYNEDFLIGIEKLLVSESQHLRDLSSIVAKRDNTRRKMVARFRETRQKRYDTMIYFTEKIKDDLLASLVF